MTNTTMDAGGKAEGIRAVGKTIFLVQDPAPPRTNRFDLDRERPYTGVVAAAGRKAIEEAEVQAGDRVSFRKGNYQVKVFSGQEYLLLDPRDIEAIIPFDEVVDTPEIMPDGVDLDRLRVPGDEAVDTLEITHEGVDAVILHRIQQRQKADAMKREQKKMARLANAVTGKQNPEIFHLGQNQ